MKRKTTVFGIEFDEAHIRGVKAVHDRKTGVQVAGEHAVTGSFHKDEEIIGGLREVRSALGIGGTDAVTACLGGKQLYAAQIPFRKVPKSELDAALTFEIRKHVPFDAATAAVEYQVIGDDGDTFRVLATAVQQQAVSRMLNLFSRAGMHPTVMDLLPLALANAARAAGDETSPAVVLHAGPGISTLVFTGDGAPFFTRNVYFTAGELFSETPRVDAERERERRLAAFTAELERSVAYYTGTFHPPDMARVLIAGEYAAVPALRERVAEVTKLPVEPLALLGELKGDRDGDDGTYAVAAALALRNDQP